MRFYHATKHNFDIPVYDELIKNRTNHINGLLGLWCSTNLSNWIRAFGKNIYSVELIKSNPFIINALDFRDECRKDAEETYFTNWRNSLIDKGFTHIEIVETNGSVEMIIVLNFDNVKEFKKI